MRSTLLAIVILVGNTIGAYAVGKQPPQVDNTNAFRQKQRFHVSTGTVRGNFNAAISTGTQLFVGHPGTPSAPGKLVVFSDTALQEGLELRGPLGGGGIKFHASEPPFSGGTVLKRAFAPTSGANSLVVSIDFGHALYMGGGPTGPWVFEKTGGGNQAFAFNGEGWFSGHLVTNKYDGTLQNNLYSIGLTTESWVNVYASTGIFNNTKTSILTFGDGSSMMTAASGSGSVCTTCAYTSGAVQTFTNNNIFSTYTYTGTGASIFVNTTAPITGPFAPDYDPVSIGLNGANINQKRIGGDSLWHFMYTGASGADAKIIQHGIMAEDEGGDAFGGFSKNGGFAVDVVEGKGHKFMGSLSSNATGFVVMLMKNKPVTVWKDDFSVQIGTGPHPQTHFVYGGLNVSTGIVAESVNTGTLYFFDGSTQTTAAVGSVCSTCAYTSGAAQTFTNGNYFSTSTYYMGNAQVLIGSDTTAGFPQPNEGNQRRLLIRNGFAYFYGDGTNGEQGGGILMQIKNPGGGTSQFAVTKSEMAVFPGDEGFGIPLGGGKQLIINENPSLTDWIIGNINPASTGTIRMGNKNKMFFDLRPDFVLKIGSVTHQNITVDITGGLIVSTDIVAGTSLTAGTTVFGPTLNASNSVCIAGDCRTVWPASHFEPVYFSSTIVSSTQTIASLTNIQVTTLTATLRGGATTYCEFQGEFLTSPSRRLTININFDGAAIGIQMRSDQTNAAITPLKWDALIGNYSSGVHTFTVTTRSDIATGTQEVYARSLICRED